VEENCDKQSHVASERASLLYSALSERHSCLEKYKKTICLYAQLLYTGVLDKVGLNRLWVRFHFLVSWGGVRLNALGTSATNWPIVPAPGDRWWTWNSRRNENWQAKPKYSEKTCPSSTLSTTNPTWYDLGSNPDLHCRKPATNRLSYGTGLAMGYMRVERLFHNVI
jgi:hypothetical protein